MRLAVCGLFHIENQLQTKHEENIVIPCLDVGSTPTGSTDGVFIERWRPLYV
jgi:hypothetical protein